MQPTGNSNLTGKTHSLHLFFTHSFFTLTLHPLFTIALVIHTHEFASVFNVLYNLVALTFQLQLTFRNQNVRDTDKTISNYLVLCMRMSSQNFVSDLVWQPESAAAAGMPTLSLIWRWESSHHSCYFLQTETTSRNPCNI